MARQQVMVNALFVLLGFVVSGAFRHLMGVQSNVPGNPGPTDDSNNNPSSDNSVNNSSSSHDIDTDQAVPAVTVEEEVLPVITPGEDQKVQFVLYLGLYGAGHEYLSKIAEKSPAVQYMTDLNVFPRDTHKLQGSLLGNETGLWSAYFSPKSPDQLDLTGTQSMLVNTLGRIKNKLSKGPEARYYVPVNILMEPFGEYGPVRYLQDPNRGPVRMISYPSVDLLYDACDEAEVDCRHIYLHRNPYELLHKSKAPHVLEAMHTSTSMLLVIASQMRMHADRTLGCWDLFTKDRSELLQWNDENGVSKSLPQVFGWTQDGASTAEQVLADNFRPLDLTNSQLHGIVPSMNQNYFDSLQKSHNMLLDICRQQLEPRRH